MEKDTLLNPDGLLSNVMDSKMAQNQFENRWKILVVDDAPEVHQLTRMVLSDYSFSNRSLEFISVYTGSEAKTIMAEHSDVAVILLDVVMETDNAGLEVVRYVRNCLQNRFVRIILRTGQPGYAPENRVVMNYDINDYKEKTELTSQKLFTSITSALRTYQHMRAIELNRRGLEKIIEASKCLFEMQSLQQFASGLLTQLTSILCIDEDAMYVTSSGISATRDDQNFVVLAATGQYEDRVDSR